MRKKVSQLKVHVQTGGCGEPRVWGSLRRLGGRGLPGEQALLKGTLWKWNEHVSCMLLSRDCARRGSSYSTIPYGGPSRRLMRYSMPCQSWLLTASHSIREAERVCVKYVERVCKVLKFRLLGSASGMKSRLSAGSASGMRKSCLWVSGMKMKCGRH